MKTKLTILLCIVTAAVFGQLTPNLTPRVVPVKLTTEQAAEIMGGLTNAAAFPTVDQSKVIGISMDLQRRGTNSDWYLNVVVKP